MPKYSSRSRKRLETCHPNLQKLFNEIIKHYDCTIIEGSRSDKKQKQLYSQDKTRADGVTKKSKHQVTAEEPLSFAIDVAPYPIPNNWGVIDLKNRNKINYQARELAEFYYFVGFVKGVANQLNIKIISGADWNNNNNLNDQTFFDLTHFELTKDNNKKHGKSFFARFKRK